jgi:hypothetical protein
LNTTGSKCGRDEKYGPIENLGREKGIEEHFLEISI